MSRLKDKAKGIGDDIPAATAVSNKLPTPPKTAPGQLMAFRDQVQPLHAQINDLEKMLENTPGKSLLIANLVVIEGRKRTLSPTERAELKENIRLHGVVTPITVRLRDDGKYEIISGHNRVEIYAELGHTVINAWVLTSMSDEQAEMDAFYANLLHPSLPDFEKFRGFKSMSDRTGKTYTDMATDAGISKSAVTQLMSFDKLPDEAKAILAANPKILGASAATDMAALMEKGKGPQIIKAIDALSKGTLTQLAAVKAAAADAPVTPPQRTEPLKIKAGRLNFAEVVSKDKTLRISFQSSDQREALEAEIVAVIKAHVDKNKG